MTLLIHSAKGCRGNIVLDASSRAKLVAPSFSIGTDGIRSVVLDIQLTGNQTLVPLFCCTKCGEEVPPTSMGTHMASACIICGETHTVNNLSMHSHITIMCKNCITAIRKYLDDGTNPGERALGYVQNYGLRKGFRVVSLETVLKSPITL